jgi:hypothetical protein
MASEEEEISLIVKCDYLSSLKLRQTWKEGLEHPAYGMSQPGDKPVQDEFRIMRRRSCMALQELSELLARCDSYAYSRISAL